MLTARMVTEREYTARVFRTLAAIALAIVILWALYLARRALLIVYLSVLLAMAFAPMVRLIERRVLPDHRRVPRVLAIFVLYLVIILLLCGIALAVVPPLITQVEDLWTRLPDFTNQAQRMLQQHHLLSSHVSLAQAVASAGGQVGTVATSAASTAASALFGAFTMFILTFYMLVDARGLSHAFARLFAPDKRVQVIRASHEIVSRVYGWLLAHLTLAAIMGGSAALGLALLGVHYFYVLALITAAGEMIPVLGPFIAGACAVGMGLASSLHQGIYVLIFFTALQQLESNLLVPVIMQERVGLSPVTVIVALAIGFELSGILGAILAVPTAAILAVVFDELMPEARAPAAIPSDPSTGSGSP